MQHRIYFQMEIRISLTIHVLSFYLTFGFHRGIEEWAKTNNFEKRPRKFLIYTFPFKKSK